MVSSEESSSCSQESDALSPQHHIALIILMLMSHQMWDNQPSGASLCPSSAALPEGLIVGAEQRRVQP